MRPSKVFMLFFLSAAKKLYEDQISRPTVSIRSRVFKNMVLFTAIYNPSLHLRKDIGG